MTAYLAVPRKNQENGAIAVDASYVSLRMRVSRLGAAFGEHGFSRAQQAWAISNGRLSK